MKKKIYVFSTQKKHQTTKTKGLMIIQNQNSIKKTIITVCIILICHLFNKTTNRVIFM